MNPFLAKALQSRFVQSKHTSGAALAFIIVWVVTAICSTWFPNHQQQFEATARALKDGAILYAMIMSGDAKPADKSSDQNQNQNKEQ